MYRSEKLAVLAFTATGQDDLLQMEESLPDAFLTDEAFGKIAFADFASAG